MERARQYLDAWNAHNSAAIVATFAAGGTYTDPTTGEIEGTAIGANARRLWDAFPDLSFEVVSIAGAGPDRVVAEWIMKGTNTGSFMGLPPTGRAVSLPGIDVIDVGADGIRSVKGYFDSRVVPEQLGLQVLVQPYQAGPFGFGYAVAAQSGSKTKPGAFSITTIWNSDAQTDEIRTLSRETIVEMLRMDGVIGVATFRIGGRGVTVTAWEKPDQTRQLMRGGTHGKAMQRFWSGLGDAAFTSVWVPERINPLWVRCNSCHRMNDYEKSAGQCGCGRKLPEAPAYF
jgi:steroid delta-isomerase-like uncharacterized protein